MAAIIYDLTKQRVKYGLF